MADQGRVQGEIRKETIQRLIKFVSILVSTAVGGPFVARLKVHGKTYRQIVVCE
jgi:hypothetical protein